MRGGAPNPTAGRRSPSTTSDVRRSSATAGKCSCHAEGRPWRRRNKRDARGAKGYGWVQFAISVSGRMIERDHLPHWSWEKRNDRHRWTIFARRLKRRPSQPLWARAAGAGLGKF